MRNKNNKKYIIIGLIAVVFIMTIAYGAYNSALNINGTTSITGNWDIRITNVQSDIHGKASNKIEPTWNELTANFKSVLNAPGDYIEYDITVTNNGNITARLDKINMSESKNEAIIFSKSGLEEGSTLTQGESKVLKVKVEYNKDITEQPKDLVADLTVSLDYVQDKTGNVQTPSINDKYLVKYDYLTNGGDSTDAVSSYQEEGTEANLEYTASKKDWDFIGWNTEATEHNKLDTYSAKAEENILYAIYKKDIKYII